MQDFVLCKAKSFQGQPTARQRQDAVRAVRKFLWKAKLALEASRAMHNKVVEEKEDAGADEAGPEITA